MLFQQRLNHVTVPPQGTLFLMPSRTCQGRGFWVIVFPVEVRGCLLVFP